VTGAGNIDYPNAPYGYPARFGDPTDTNHIPELCVVGATNQFGQVSSRSAFADWVKYWAPGYDVRNLAPEFGLDRTSDHARGTSEGEHILILRLRDGSDCAPSFGHRRRFGRLLPGSQAPVVLFSGKERDSALAVVKVGGH
jgi:hypothetical protein